MPGMTQKLVAQMQGRLRHRESELYEDLRRELARPDDGQQLAGEALDTGDATYAALLRELDEAEIGRDLNELRAVGAALRRIRVGRYGLCVDCERPIDFEHLQAQPAAARCMECQRSYERHHLGAGSGARH